VKYHKRYDEHNSGTEFVFNTFYNALKDRGIRANLIAVPGKDVERYIDYASIVCGKAPRARVYFFENKADHLAIIKNGLSKSKRPITNKINVVSGDVLCYEHFIGKVSGRVEDLGLGLGIREMMSSCILRLFRQSRLPGSHNKWKAQILCSALRKVPATEWLELYQRYLSTVDLKIKSFNGLTDPDEFAARGTGRLVHRYVDKQRRCCSVYEHKIVLEDNKRQAKLYLFTHMNGSFMMASMLVYK